MIAPYKAMNATTHSSSLCILRAPVTLLVLHDLHRLLAQVPAVGVLMPEREVLLDYDLRQKHFALPSFQVCGFYREKFFLALLLARIFTTVLLPS